jgi:hypothetical protein
MCVPVVVGGQRGKGDESYIYTNGTAKHNYNYCSKKGNIRAVKGFDEIPDKQEKEERKNQYWLWGRPGLGKSKWANIQKKKKKKLQQVRDGDRL